MSAIRQNSSSPASPHVALAVILAFIATLKGFGNNPPFGIDSIKRWNGCAPSESCLKSAKQTKKCFSYFLLLSSLCASPQIHGLINDLIYKNKWCPNFSMPLLQSELEIIHNSESYLKGRKKHSDDFSFHICCFLSYEITKKNCKSKRIFLSLPAGNSRESWRLLGKRSLRNLKTFYLLSSSCRWTTM